MKKLTLFLAIVTVLAAPAFAQEPQELNLQLDANASLADSEQPISQQLIGYAIEVSSTALSEKKPVGRYYCNKIYSSTGYTQLQEYPCELIIHSEKGPIVVRYKGVLPDTDMQIRAFLQENQMQDTLYYNNGRFRFALDDADLLQETDETQDKKTPSERQRQAK
ncbi:MAG: hypothetical protein E7013_02895 [Alphaproteobacteria bacterium]|nr:hypothetical protein [Alphaproteobacteria bacterium]